MRFYIVIILTMQFLITGCKQDVAFSSLDSSTVPPNQNTGSSGYDDGDDIDEELGTQFVRKTEILNIQGGGRTDILFVIDNSSSMLNEQKKISDRFNKFIEQIEGLDWNIAISTTDSRASKAWGDGKIVPFENGKYYLTSNLNKVVAQQLFGKNVRRSESGSDTEMGILATYRTIERSMNPQNTVDREITQFFRDDAALAVVVVSDEDESGNGNKNKGKNLIKLVEQKWGKKKVFQYNSIIAHTMECLSGEGASMGKEYKRLSELTNGIIGDICANNYSQMLSDLGKGVADLVKVHALKCHPKDINDDGKVDIMITAKNGSDIPGFSINKNKLEFDIALNPDDYEIQYFCLE